MSVIQFLLANFFLDGVGLCSFCYEALIDATVAIKYVMYSMSLLVENVSCTMAYVIYAIIG